MELKIGQCSEQGPVRDENEDVILVTELPGATVCLVADGERGWFGEAGSGAFLSQSATRVIVRELRGQLTDPMDSEKTSAIIRQSILQAHAELLALRQLDTNLCGASVVLGVFATDQTAYCVGVGDSAACLIHGNDFEPLTVPDTVAKALAQAGTIPAEEVATHRFHNVLYQFLGCEKLGREPEVKVRTAQAGERFLLCTDGLWRVLSESQIVAAVQQHPEPQHCADVLCQLALERGSRDNVSCIVIAVE